jgi:hypothetical protein
MKLKRLSTDRPDFIELDEMIAAMNELLEGNPKAAFTTEELCLFQDDDGSFKLLDSYKVPIEARIDYCYPMT